MDSGFRVYGRLASIALVHDCPRALLLVNEFYQ
jgi:hypothetical protein